MASAQRARRVATKAMLGLHQTDLVTGFLAVCESDYTALVVEAAETNIELVHWLGRVAHIMQGRYQIMYWVLKNIMNQTDVFAVLKTLRVSGESAVVTRVCCGFLACACALNPSASFTLRLELGRRRTFHILDQTLQNHAGKADIVSLCFAVLASISCAGSQQCKLPLNFERHVLIALEKHQSDACVTSFAITLLSKVSWKLVTNAACKTRDENSAIFSCLALLAEHALQNVSKQAALDACMLLDAVFKVDLGLDGHLITPRRATLLVTALTAHMSQLDVARVATGIIRRCHLLDRAFDDKDLGLVVEVLIKSTLSHPCDGTVAFNCFKALIEADKRPTLLAHFRQIGGTESLSCWMLSCAEGGSHARDAPRMSEARELALALLVTVANDEGDRNAMARVVDGGGVTAVVGIMSAFPESEQLANQGCWFISNAWPALTARRGVAERAAGVALASVKRFGANATVARNGLNVLSHILRGDKAVLRNARLVEDCLAAAASALEDHFQFVEVIQNAMSLFAFASVLPENRAAVASAGGVALAVKMCAHLDHAIVESCFVLLAWMVNEDGVARALSEADILSVADKRLREHLTSQSTLAQNCCHIIGCLAADDDHVLKTVPCVPTLVAAIRVRARLASERDMVACHACAALCSIANVQQGAARALQHKAAAALVHVLKSNPPTSSVAINAMATVLSIARSSGNRGLTELVQAGAIEAALAACEVMAVARELLAFLASQTASQGRVILLVDEMLRVCSENVRNVLHDLRLPRTTDRERAEAELLKSVQMEEQVLASASAKAAAKNKVKKQRKAVRRAAAAVGTSSAVCVQEPLENREPVDFSGAEEQPAHLRLQPPEPLPCESQQQSELPLPELQSADPTSVDQEPQLTLREVVAEEPESGWPAPDAAFGQQLALPWLSTQGSEWAAGWAAGWQAGASDGVAAAAFRAPETALPAPLPRERALAQKDEELRLLRAELAEKDEQLRALRARLAKSEERRRKALECSVCEDAPVDRVLVSCGHTFCAGCMRSWQQAKGNDGVTRCPMCDAAAQIVQPFILSS